jgi:hypothetical protein
MGHQTTRVKIDMATQGLNAHERELHEQALGEGYKDEVCPKADCEAVLLAHHHFLRCDPKSCPMISRQNLNSDGQPKTLLEMLAEKNEARAATSSI